MSGLFLHINVWQVQDSLSDTTLAPVPALDLSPLMKPDPVAFSFDRPGWYFLGGMVLLALLLFVAWLGIRYWRNKYRREAVKVVENANERFKKGKEPQLLNVALKQLKIVAIQTFGRGEVAALSGMEWLSFLEKSGKETPFTAYKDLYFSSMYEENFAGDAGKVEQLFALSRKWIQTHARKL